MTSMPNLYEKLLSVHGSAPVVTCYTEDGRVELSGKVLGNWVAKASSMLVEDCEVEAGGRVAIDLPAHHWRGSYWMVAAWAVGASVVVAEPSTLNGDVDTVLTHRPDAWLTRVDAQQVVAVGLDLLARPQPTCPVIQEAGTISTHPDVLAMWESLPSTAVALASASQALSWSELLRVAGAHSSQRVILPGATPADDVLLHTAAAIASTGSVVLTYLNDPLEVQRIAEAERASLLSASSAYLRGGCLDDGQP